MHCECHKELQKDKEKVLFYGHFCIFHFPSSPHRHHHLPPTNLSGTSQQRIKLTEIEIQRVEGLHWSKKKSTLMMMEGEPFFWMGE